MQKEALEYTKKCDQYQRFASNTHQPGGFLNPLSSSWPFAQWGLDIVGPFPKAVGNKKYLLVDIDYFTKWVEAEPFGEYPRCGCKEVSLEEHCHSLQNTSYPYFGQWTSIR